MSRLSQSTSLAVHAALLVMLLLWSVHPRLAEMSKEVTHLLDPAPVLRGPAGGGGMHQNTPVQKGMLPPRSTRSFTPPMQRVDYQPKLAVPVTIDAPPELATSNAVFGDPNGIGALSGGSGGPGGLGDGIGHNIGGGTGDRYGPGADGVFSAGHGVSAPVPIHIMEPEYSEPARRARLSGSVLVCAEIGPDGKPRNLRVTRGLGLGLDERAMDAVAKWLFKPGLRDGRPVTVRATFEVNFRLL